jgi:hypothetical protein
MRQFNHCDCVSRLDPLAFPGDRERSTLYIDQASYRKILTTTKAGGSLGKCMLLEEREGWFFHGFVLKISKPPKQILDIVF